MGPQIGFILIINSIVLFYKMNKLDCQSFGKIIVGFRGHMDDSTTAVWGQVIFSSIVFLVLKPLDTVGGIHHGPDTLQWSCWLETVTAAFQSRYQLQAE